MNKIPLVDLNAEYQSIKSEIDASIERVVKKANFILGEEVELFEKQFAIFCNAKYCVGVASGTTALHLALLACGVQPGDEVITSTHSFIATAEAISHCGAIPVFVDINPLTYTIDPDQIETVITPKTKVIIPVHLYGQPADMTPIKKIAERHGLLIVEDAAQAHGAEYHGQRVGTIGDVACFSFYPGKNLGAYGDAGAIVTNRADIAEKVFILRNHGRAKGMKYEHSIVGYGERIDTIHASILSAKLQYLETWNERRRIYAKRYSEMLSGTGIGIPFELPDVKHVYHLYVVRHPQRDIFIEAMQQNKIGVGIHYPIPLHLQPAYKFLGYRDGIFPHAEKASREVFSLPLFPTIEHAQQDFVVDTIQKTLGGLPNELN
jgi:dTDP-4-amino-4,6-dideoxygalactose transaminase